MEFTDLLILCRDFVINQPKLSMVYTKNGIAFQGYYKFYAVEPIYGIEVEDEYLLHIDLGLDYPNVLPRVYEVGNKINNYSHKYQSNELCLGVDSEMRLFIKQNYDLKTFMNIYVTNYLFNYSAFQKYGFLPLGERSHYNVGVQEFYQEYFDITDIRIIANILRIIIRNPNLSQIEFCVCGSGKRVKNCHGDKVKKLIDAIPVQFLSTDLKSLEGK